MSEHNKIFLSVHELQENLHLIRKAQKHCFGPSSRAVFSEYWLRRYYRALEKYKRKLMYQIYIQGGDPSPRVQRLV